MTYFHTSKKIKCKRSYIKWSKQFHNLNDKIKIIHTKQLIHDFQIHSLIFTKKNVTPQCRISSQSLRYRQRLDFKLCRLRMHRMVLRYDLQTELPWLRGLAFVNNVVTRMLDALLVSKLNHHLHMLPTVFLKQSLLLRLRRSWCMS